MVWTCYAVKLGISTLLAAAKLGISPPIPTITLSIQHEGPLLSQALGIFTMNMSTHFGKHYLCGKCTCLSLKTSSKKKKAKPWTKYAIPLQNPNNLWFGTMAIGNLCSLCSEERRIQKEQKDSRLEFLFTTDFIGVDMKIVFCPGWCDGVSPLGTKWGRNNCEHPIIVGLNFGQDGCWDRR